jgi:Na+/H+ antiporter NhaC
MNLTRDIARNSVFILIPAATISAFLPWSIKGILGTSHANAKMLFFAQFRFVIFILIITALAYLKLVTIPGLIAGFSIVFVQVLITGLKHARRPGN